MFQFKNTLIFGVAAAMAITMLAGCASEPTPEEIAASSIAAVTAEEQQTGMKRLDSPNLTEYEKPLANFVNGLKSKDANAVANALGCLNVFGDGSESLESWIISNNYEDLAAMELHDIQIISSKDGKQAELQVFLEEPNEEKDNFISYTTDFNGTSWAVTPPSGLELNYIFYAPTNLVSVNDVDLSQYATSDPNYGYQFTIPRMAVVDNSPACKITTDVGSYDGNIVSTGASSYSAGTAIAIATLSEEQRADMNGFFVSCVNNIFNLVKNGAAREQFSDYILDSDAVNALFPSDENDQAAVLSNANNVSGIEVYAGTADSGFPDSYTYHFSSSNSVTMNIRYKVSLASGGECHRLATVTMVYMGDTWKIEKIVSTNPLFTDLTAFSPEW